uniref:S1-like domain-containing protein n=1 Tax=Kalanchoe fedtschenkoi TaxID=63787 RepID=A0A7N0THL8_KALFE
MKAGRKHMKKLAEERKLTVPDGECIMQVVSLRGSNIVEVMDAAGENSLALIPAKFQKTMWIKRGNFVLVDETGREQALESGSKITCLVTRVLFHEQVRQLQKSPEWPQIFRSTAIETCSASATIQSEQKESFGVSDDDDEDSDDGLPPLEANMNRAGMPEWRSGTDSDSESTS